MSAVAVWHWPLYLCAGVVAGLMNSVAGGGMLVTFGTLSVFGVSPILANGTSTVSLVPGAVGSLVAYRGAIHARDAILWMMVLCGALGGIFGAEVAIHAGDARFMAVVPWTLLVATALFAVQPRVQLWLARRDVAHVAERRLGWLAWTLLGAAQLIIAVYGGFFGGGMGILMLAALAAVGVADLTRANAVKTAAATAINGTAALGFLLAGQVEWRAWVPLTLGAIAGGYGGARVARNVRPGLVRAVIVVIGLAVAAHSFWRILRR